MTSKTPRNVLKLKGSFRKDRHGKTKVRRRSSVDKAQLRCPGWLNKAQIEAWKDLKKACNHAEIVLSRADVPLLVQSAILYAELMTSPETFNAGKHTALRLTLKSLGLADSEPGD